MYRGVRCRWQGRVIMGLTFEGHLERTEGGRLMNPFSIFAEVYLSGMTPCGALSVLGISVSLVVVFSIQP